MAAFDKWIICEKLKALGWVETQDNYLVPPESLWADRPATLYVYEAQKLQEMLGVGLDMEDSSEPSNAQAA